MISAAVHNANPFRGRGRGVSPKDTMPTWEIDQFHGAAELDKERARQMQFRMMVLACKTGSATLEAVKDCLGRQEAEDVLGENRNGQAALSPGNPGH
jgi:hypothetical protein